MEEKKEKNTNKPATYYKNRIATTQAEVNELTKKSRMWVVVRLISFAAIIGGVYATYPQGGWSMVVGIVLIMLFLFFVRKSVENKEALFLAKTILEMNQNELSLLEKHVLDVFDGGEEFKNPKHAFSYDMDVFGANGCFQYLNRTVTKEGKKVLAEKLLNGVEDIPETQEAVQELSEKVTWTQLYRAKGMTAKMDENDLTTTNGWGEENVKTTSVMKIMVYVLPVIGIASTLLYSVDLISGFLFSLIFIAVLAPSLLRVKETNAFAKSLSAIGNRIKAMEEQLACLSKEEFHSPKLKVYYATLFEKEKNGAAALKELSTLLKHVEYRNNVLVAIALNFYLAWDVRITLKAAKWKANYGEYLAGWEHILFELEALISGANLQFNRQDETCYPEINKSDAKVALIRLGHPLIPSEKLVVNDYVMDEQEQFSIVTGPNMAGKSTFLRSVGVNLMLAKAGFPVLAKKFVFPDLKLYSSMRTADDLSSESSYFHAELVRLRFIVDAIERGEKVFIILDEILKGTNSKDKEQGSASFLEKLVALNAQGIIATHDLKLTELADESTALVNKYFDTTIEGDDITFDYTIRDGVAQNMNASFLLKKMGLISC